MSKRDISHLKELDAPTASATVHGAVTSISPVKKGRKSAYFEATLADTTSMVRLVGFSNQHQIALNELHVNKSPVKITNCQVKPSRNGGQGFDILLNTDSEISVSAKKLEMESIMTTPEKPKLITLDTLPSLPQYDKVSVNIKVLKVFQPQEVGQMKTCKQDVSIADRTAASTVVLWEEHVNSLKEGQSYHLANFHVKEFQSRKHLSMPKQDFSITPIEMVETNITPPPDEEHTTIRNVTIIGVPQLDDYNCCMKCNARVEPLSPPLGKCTAFECQMMQVYDLCKKQVSARVLLRYCNQDGASDQRITCFAFGDIVNQLANLPSDQRVSVPDLLLGRPIAQLEYITNKKIITLVLRGSSI